MSNTIGAINWIKLLILGLIWGSSFMAVSIALDGFAPMTIAATRITVGALALLLITAIMRIELPSLNTRHGRTVWLCALGMGFFSNALPFSLLSWGKPTWPVALPGSAWRWCRCLCCHWRISWCPESA